MRGGKEAAAVSSSKRRRSIRREIFFLSSMRLFSFFLWLLLSSSWVPPSVLLTVCLSVCLSLAAAAHFHNPMPYGLSVSACSSSITITTRRRKCHQAHHPSLCNWCTYIHTLSLSFFTKHPAMCQTAIVLFLSLSETGGEQAGGGKEKS